MVHASCSVSETPQGRPKFRQLFFWCGRGRILTVVRAASSQSRKLTFLARGGVALERQNEHYPVARSSRACTESHVAHSSRKKAVGRSYYCAYRLRLRDGPSC